MIPIALNAGSVWPLGYFEINDIDLLVTDSTLEEDLLADLKKINSDLVHYERCLTFNSSNLFLYLYIN